MSRWLSQLAEVQTKHQNGEEMGFKWLWMWYGSTLPSVLKAQLPSHFDSLLNESYLSRMSHLWCVASSRHADWVCASLQILEIIRVILKLYDQWKNFDDRKEMAAVLNKMPKPKPPPNRWAGRSTVSTTLPSPAPPQRKRFRSSSDQGPYSEAPLSSALNSV